MDSNTPVQTAYGQVPFQKLLDAFEKKKQYEQNKKEWLQTDAGKEYQRKKAKEYYERHREEVLAKRAARYKVEHEELLNRAKEYYHSHNEECRERNRKYREKAKQEIPKIESSAA